MVDADGLDPDEQLTRTRLRVGHLLEPKHLRAAGLVYDNSTHAQSLLRVDGCSAARYIGPRDSVRPSLSGGRGIRDKSRRRRLPQLHGPPVTNGLHIGAPVARV
jgi:hypothetical protein